MKTMDTKSNTKLYEQKVANIDLTNAERRVVVQLMAEPISYMPDDRFRKPSVMAEYMASEVSVYPGSALQDQEEEILFLQFNYSRHRLCQVRRKLLRLREWPIELVRELLDYNDKQLDYRSRIVTANMGLVLAMAKRVDYAGVEFTDLVSEGSVALLRATEKFDCARGIKFSTYACRAILKGFSRAAKQNYRYRSHFSTQFEISMERDDFLDRKREEKHGDWLEEVRMIVDENLAELSDTEMSVVQMRFSLDDQDREPLTLKEVGAKLGLTKERIRQIQNKALEKLRVVAQQRVETV